MWSKELDSMNVVGPFQLRTFYDSICWWGKKLFPSSGGALPADVVLNLNAITSKPENSHLSKSAAAAFIYKHLICISRGGLPTFLSSSLPLSLQFQCKLCPQVCYAIPTWQPHLTCNAFPHKGGSPGLYFIASSLL